MGLMVLLIFLCLPVAEIWVLNRVGSILGFWDTLFLLILSGVFGVYLAKLQGKAVLLKVQRCLAEGRAPTTEMMDGLLIFLGGVLFVIPGFITDGIGLLLIFPPTRWLIRYWISKSTAAGFMAQQASGRFGGSQSAARSTRGSQGPAQEIPRPRGTVQDAEIIDGS